MKIGGFPTLLTICSECLLLRVLKGTLNFLAAARNDRFPSRDFRAHSILYPGMLSPFFSCTLESFLKKKQLCFVACLHANCSFFQSSNSTFLLPNSQTQTLVMRKTIAKNQAKNFTILESRPLKSTKKKSFLVNFHIWHKFSSFKTTNWLILGFN